jgi:hypothetical protein
VTTLESLEHRQSTTKRLLSLSNSLCDVLHDTPLPLLSITIPYFASQSITMEKKPEDDPESGPENDPKNDLETISDTNAETNADTDPVTVKIPSTQGVEGRPFAPRQTQRPT